MSSFTYEGDIALVSEWLGFARSKQMQMHRLGSNGWNIRPTDSVLIMIRTNPDHIHIVVGGGTYHFIYEYPDDVFAYLKGKIPQTGEENTANVTISAIQAGQNDTALNTNPAALASDRHAWYSADGYTVLSGYGSQYATNRAPHIFMDSGSIFLGQIELYKNGERREQSPIVTAWNGFKLDNVLVAMAINGDLQYHLIGEQDVFSTPNTIGNIPDVPPESFRQLIPPAYVNGNYLSWYLVYDSHSMQAGFEVPACYWSVGKDGTKAVGVSYANFNVNYLAYDSGDDTRVPEADDTLVVIVPFLIEVSFSLSFNPAGEPSIVMTTDAVTRMDFETEKQFLIAADFYYYPPKDPEFQQAYEPDENEMIMVFAERFNYEIGGETYFNEQLEEIAPVQSDNVSIVIRSKTTEYIRDMFHYNEQLFGTENDPDIPDWVTARVLAVDLRSMAYVVNEQRRSDFENLPFSAHRIIFRGAEIFSCQINQAGAVNELTRNPYNRLDVEDPRLGNLYDGFWGAFVFGEKMAANPFDDSLFMYYKRGIAGGSYVIDTYTYFDEVEAMYKTLFNYHYQSAGGDIDGEHCISNVWII